MIFDLRSEPGAADAPSDVCIVGAGAAGIVLARQLARRGHSVCLLESGGLDFEQATQDLYRGANVGMTYYDLDQSRLRFFGGTVAIWGGRCALFDPIDFQRREWVPHSGWPIGRAELDPYYRRAHDLFELGEFNYEHDVWRELRVRPLALDPNKLDTVLWRFDEVTERFTAARSRDVIDHPKIRILLHANVVKLQAGSDARTIEHLDVQPIDGKRRRVRAKRYVLACGGIENARLLLVSDDVERTGIGNGHDQVGRYFMEHPTGRIAQVHSLKAFEIWAAFQKRFMRHGPPLAPVLRLSDDVQRERQTLNTIVTFKLQRDPSKGVALGNKLYHNLKHSIAPSRGGRVLDRGYRIMRSWIHKGVREPVERVRAALGATGLYVIIRGEQAPNAESRVLLSTERDRLGNRRADLSWRLNSLDKHSARVMVETLDSELNRLGVGGAEPSEWLSDPAPEWPVDPTVGNHPIAGYHHLGGTCMSSEPAAGVVNPDCRVHGYENLYIAGSSVFRTGGWANPTLTIVALALRLADHLDREIEAEKPRRVKHGERSVSEAATV